MDFERYEKSIREMGTHSGAYRDLNLNFFRHEGTPYHVSAFYNALRQDGQIPGKLLEPLRVNEAFSATISYLGTYLHRRGFAFEFINSFQDEKEELAEKLKKNNILTIAITTTYYVFVLPILEVVEFIKQYNQTAKIIVGGPFISTQVRTQDEASLLYLLEKVIAADFYVNSSQGETTLVNLLGALKEDLPLDNINNIYYRDGNRCIATPLLKENNKIAENYVNWDLFRGRVGSYANVRTAISCPFSCSFCGFPRHAGAYQTSPPQILEKEFNGFERLESLVGINVIDDTFNVPVKRFKELLRMMINNRYTFKWMSNFRCQFVDRETIELMKQSGCEGVFLGIESASDRILKNMNKAASVAKYLEGISLLKEYGILTFGSFIIGFPGETSETVQQSIDFIEESGIDFFRAHLWYCDPITPIWQEREKYHIKGECFEWSHATMDARTACDWVDKIFINTKNSTWIPQYNFDFDNLWHLLHRGFSIEQIREFLTIFNSGVKEKLMNPSRDELSPETIKRLKDFCISIDGLEAGSFDNKIELTEDYGVNFDF
jgi:radical SAM PhpK family P-methyltransferase